MAESNLTAERLRELLIYDQETGVFTHRRTKGGARAGKQAGKLTKRGYRNIGVDGKIYQAHRLAWLYVYGSWPSGVIDHMDGLSDNNVIANLRDVSLRTNAENKRRPAHSGSSGLLGVTWCASKGLWMAQITVNRKTKFLGRRADKHEAHNLYLEAKRRLHEGCTI